MKYQYNFGFFAEWMAANPQIQKGIVLQALGVRASSGVKKWLEGKHPMPVISMLRFCNSFNIPISAFFRDQDAEGDTAAIVPGKPKVNDQLEPDGGYDRDIASRQRGERSILDPLDVKVTPSVVPGAIVVEREQIAGDEWPTEEPQALPTDEHDILQRLIGLEEKNQEHVNLLLSIISRQQNLIADLNSRIMMLTGDGEKRPTRYMVDDASAMEINDK